MEWLRECVSDLVHSSKHTRSRSAGGMLRRSRLTNPRRRVPAHQRQCLLCARERRGKGGGILPDEQPGQQKQSRSEPVQPVLAHQRGHARVLDDPQVSLVKEHAPARPHHPRQKLWLSVDQQPFVAEKKGVGGHHDGAGPELAFHQDRATDRACKSSATTDPDS